jgi:hypothetical protein
MWVEAILSKDDLEKTLTDFCPLRIALGDDGSIQISDPRNMQLVPERGLRMSVTVEVHWPILGITVPVSIRLATLELRPEILKKPEGETLTFRLQLDDVDISIVPAIFDRGIVDLVNKELDAKHVELSWAFPKTLSHVFELPAALASARAIDLRVAWGNVKISSEALVLAVSFRTKIEPRGAGREAGAPISRAVEKANLRSMASRSKTLRTPTNLAWVGGVALLAGLGVSAILLTRRPRRRSLFEQLGEYPRQ